jgi:putative membrane protein
MNIFATSIGCAMIAGLALTNAIAKDESPDDQTFVTQAAQGGQMEIKLGHLAAHNGSSSAVKTFGTHMVMDHTKLNKELGAAATAAGLTVPAALSEDQKAEYAKLSKETGKKFDKEYVQLMLKAHTDDLAAFQKAETTVQDAGLKTAISGAIPVIQDHLKMVQEDATKMGVSNP